MSNYQLYKNNNVNPDIFLDKKEILRYLGYYSANVDILTDKSIEDAIIEIKEISDMKYVYGIFPLYKDMDSILVKNTLIKLLDDDIKNHLEHSNEVAIMAATLGFDIEKKIRYYSVTDLTKGIIFDACATTFIEGLCDYIENEIKKIAKERGCDITFRYGPGYGDLSINIQQDILRVLNAEKLIGLTTTETSILLPRKSVTALIGFTKETTKKKNDCKNCNLYGNCEFSKEGCESCVK